MVLAATYASTALWARPDRHEGDGGRSHPADRQRCRTRIHAKTSNGTSTTTMMTIGHMGASVALRLVSAATCAAC